MVLILLEALLVMDVREGGEVDVTITCLCYNHKDYIAKALDGFLTQKTEYTFEILVHDDASTDGSVEILQDYEAQYPGVVRVVYQEENQYSKKPLGGMIYKFLYPLARGRYIAFCEGDDFWTDPLKLQKQVSYLEGNPDYALCFHNYNDLEDGRLTLHSNAEMRDMSLADYARGISGIQTLTVVSRNVFTGLKVDEDVLKHMTGSYFWFSIAASYGLMKYMDEVMAVRRVHPQGVWSGKSLVEQGVMSLSNKFAIARYFREHEVYPILRKLYIRLAYSYAFRAVGSGHFAAGIRFLRLSVRLGVDLQNVLVPLAALVRKFV